MGVGGWGLGVVGGGWGLEVGVGGGGFGVGAVCPKALTLARRSWLRTVCGPSKSRMSPLCVDRLQRRETPGSSQS